MKKRGFTLAEVMVALALVGVIASLTIPTFVSSSRNRANAAKLATTVTAVETAFTTMISSEAVNDLSETNFAETPSEANLSRFFKLSGSAEDLETFYNDEAPFVTLNRAGSQPPVSSVFQSKNGALLIYNADDVEPSEEDNHPGSIGQLSIDVNGNALPNVWGRDVFFFRIGYDGMLYPAGGDIFALMDENGANMLCEDGGTKNQGCTARLIENNYEIDY